MSFDCIQWRENALRGPALTCYIIPFFVEQSVLVNNEARRPRTKIAIYNDYISMVVVNNKIFVCALVHVHRKHMQKI